MCEVLVCQEEGKVIFCGIEIGKELSCKFQALFLLAESLTILRRLFQERRNSAFNAAKLMKLDCLPERGFDLLRICGTLFAQILSALLHSFLEPPPKQSTLLEQIGLENGEVWKCEHFLEAMGNLRNKGSAAQNGETNSGTMDESSSIDLLKK